MPVPREAAFENLAAQQRTHVVRRIGVDRSRVGRRKAEAGEPTLLQPHLPAILDQREGKQGINDGNYRHAPRKRAKAGDFRVQDDYGGTLHDCEPTPAQRALASQAMAACPHAPAYGRVDMVQDADGNSRVMELELIEPELWLRRHPPAADAFAAAIAARLGAPWARDTRD